MPKVFEDLQNNLFFYILTNDHEPAHIHVYKGRKKDRKPGLKINIGSINECPKLVLTDDYMKDADIVKAINLVGENQEMLLSKWQNIHGVSQLEKRTDRGKSKRRNSQSQGCRKKG
jgi:hypothetical protein